MRLEFLPQVVVQPRATKTFQSRRSGDMGPSSRESQRLADGFGRIQPAPLFLLELPRPAAVIV